MRNRSTIKFSIILSLVSLFVNAQNVVMKALDAPNTKTIIVSYQKDFKRDNCEEGYGETVTYRKDIVYKVSEFALPEEKKKKKREHLNKQNN